MDKKQTIHVYRMGTKYDVNSIVVDTVIEKLNSLQDCFHYVEKEPIVLEDSEEYYTLNESRTIELISLNTRILLVQ